MPYRTDEHGRKEFRERDADQDREREKERRQKEKERIRRQDEERRKRRERQDGENSCKKQEEEGKREKERALEKKKGENPGDSSHSERLGKPAKDNKKEESGKRERLRNKVMAVAQIITGLKSHNCFSAFLKRCFFGPGPACYSAVPARGQEPQSGYRRRRSRVQLRGQEAARRDRESGRQGR